MSTKGSKTHLYEALEIQPGASEAEIKKAYRKLAMVCAVFRSSPPPSILPKLYPFVASYRGLTGGDRALRGEY